MFPILVLLLVSARKSLLERTLNHISTPDGLRFASRRATSLGMSRSDVEFRAGYASLVQAGGDGADQEAPRIEVSFGSSVGLRNAVLVAKKTGTLPDEGAQDEHESMTMMSYNLCSRPHLIR